LLLLLGLFGKLALLDVGGKPLLFHVTTKSFQGISQMLAALLQHTGRANVSLLLEEAHFGPLCFDTRRHGVQSCEQLDSVTARELKTEVQGPAVTQFTVPQYLIHRS
jgi:hypothetical protein